MTFKYSKDQINGAMSRLANGESREDAAAAEGMTFSSLGYYIEKAKQANRKTGTGNGPKTRRTDAEKRELVSRFKASGISLTKWCHENRMPIATMSSYVNGSKERKRRKDYGIVKGPRGPYKTAKPVTPNYPGVAKWQLIIKGPGGIEVKKSLPGHQALQILEAL